MPGERQAVVRRRAVTALDGDGERCWRVLYCEECRCCSELGKGWVANVAYDPDGNDDEPPCVALYCPPCAARYFGYRPDVAATYVCTWEPRPDQPTEAT